MVFFSAITKKINVDCLKTQGLGKLALVFGRLKCHIYIWVLIVILIALTNWFFGLRKLHQWALECTECLDTDTLNYDLVVLHQHEYQLGIVNVSTRHSFFYVTPSILKTYLKYNLLGGTFSYMSIFYFSFWIGGFVWYFAAFQFLLKFRGIIRSVSSEMSPVALRRQCVDCILMLFQVKGVLVLPLSLYTVS